MLTDIQRNHDHSKHDCDHQRQAGKEFLAGNGFVLAEIRIGRTAADRTADAGEGPFGRVAAGFRRLLGDPAHRVGLAVLPGPNAPDGGGDGGELAVGLAPAFATALGPLAGGRTLADIPRSDRLAELGFELPLAGGEVARADVSLADLVPLLRQHLPPADPMAAYLASGYQERIEADRLGGQQAGWN